VKICCSHAGVSVGEDGGSHQCLEDIALMRMIPGMTVVVPADAKEARLATFALAEMEGPAYMRTARLATPVFEEDYPFELGKANVLREGKDIAIFACGLMVNEALEAADALEQQGISAEIIKLGMLAPNSFKLCLQSIEKTSKIIVCEEVCNSGCVGSKLLSLVASSGLKLEAAKLMNLGDGIVSHGTVKELRRDTDIDAQAIIAAGLEMCSKAAEVI